MILYTFVIYIVCVTLLYIVI